VAANDCNYLLIENVFLLSRSALHKLCLEYFTAQSIKMPWIT